MNGLILFAHGSRDPAWRLPFEAMLASVRAASDKTTLCELAYLELMQPDFGSIAADLAAKGVAHIRVLPVFLAAGKHLRTDLPELVQVAITAHPQLSFTVLPPVGESPALHQAIVNLALAA